VPFVFSANGRPYLKQVETQSGIWFRDTRKPANHRRALVDWPTPDGLLGMLDIDAEAAQADLKTRPIEFGFPLRPYQKRAIEIIEDALATDRRTMLLAMATGTGKTKLAIALLYRLLSAKRFRRVCFVVDRSALGTQAAGEFATTRIVSAKTFADIFGLKGLGDVTPDSETKVHICTIQGLVKRVLYNEDSSQAPPVDQYDLMVVDECHRGYLLDREMSDAELGFWRLLAIPDTEQYSSWQHDWERGESSKLQQWSFFGDAERELQSIPELSNGCGSVQRKRECVWDL
jgi:type I restriction enzyme R subunit